MKQDHQGHEAMGAGMLRSHYGMFAANLALSGIVMYFVMYTMIDRPADLYNNLNNVYMTLMMVTSMAIFMLLMMSSMFPDKRVNIVLYVAFAGLFLLALAGMRTQALVGDRQFLRAMIPHHSGAVLMCERSRLSDREILGLCKGIVRSQTQEIAQMKALLARHSGS